MFNVQQCAIYGVFLMLHTELLERAGVEDSEEEGVSL